MTPVTEGQKLGAFLRHSLPAMIFAGLWLGARQVPALASISPWPVLPLVAFGIFATRQSIAYGALSLTAISEPDLKTANAKLETQRGLAFGLAAALGLVLA